MLTHRIDRIAGPAGGRREGMLVEENSVSKGLEVGAIKLWVKYASVGFLI